MQVQPALSLLKLRYNLVVKLLPSCQTLIAVLVGGDGLGAVECSEVQLADLPPQLEDTRVFALTLRGNGLRKFPVGKLREMGEIIKSGMEGSPRPDNIVHTGAWSLEISDNHLHSIPSLAFTGLERSLWCLILSNNKFTRIPSDSVSRLQKLNRLDLAG